LAQIFQQITQIHTGTNELLQITHAHKEIYKQQQAGQHALVAHHSTVVADVKEKGHATNMACQSAFVIMGGGIPPAGCCCGCNATELARCEVACHAECQATLTAAG
jgi:hypothetical protein